MGVAKIRFPVNEYGDSYEFPCKIVSADVPILLGGPGMKGKMKLDGVGNENADGYLVIEDWRISLEYRDGHFYIPSEETDKLITKEELHKVLSARKNLEKRHKKFGRASAEKLYNVMDKAGESVTKEDLDTLKDIGKTCHACQIYARSPKRYVASAPETILSTIK